ncbi:MAG: bifunctional response regulator/alkaline phosphatase family protein [Bacteroidaceae bacterium]|nr:bifunctional response regulator/alkaline phosphatase family protein [Bacteroidaceae bacterium]
MTAHLLWVDDEIDILKAHIIFLQKKGYEVDTASNGYDAIDLCQQHTYDLILLDENMPGLSGLETLQRIKEAAPAVPVVMVTKNEEEQIMDQAIGSQIADYLIKPVNPTQILLSLKKNIHQRTIIAEHTQSAYSQDFGRMEMLMSDANDIDAWKDVYKRLVTWELQLSEADSSMLDMLATQKRDANQQFARFISKNYLGWLSDMLSHDRPIMSPDIFRTRVFPQLDKGQKVFLIVVDNLRFDQWRVLMPDIAELFHVDEDLYLSILPTATQYARNAIFSGLMPDVIAREYPDLWVDEDSEEGKNLNEAPLIQTQLDRFRRHHTFSYYKVNDNTSAEQMLAQLSKQERYDFTVCIINFIDMLSHARTESRMVRELATNEAAYRSISLSWFRHSAINALFKTLAQSNYRILLTTDHGSIRCSNPIRVKGDRNTNTNLRYKLGKNLDYNPKEVFEIVHPEQALLPIPNLSTRYIFATGDSFFAYPNNYNYYVSYYHDTFQHGGISMEEMLIPLIELTPKGR